MIYVYFITTCILNIGHVTSKHITCLSHEKNKKKFKDLALKKGGGGEIKVESKVLENWEEMVLSNLVVEDVCNLTPIIKTSISRTRPPTSSRRSAASEIYPSKPLLACRPDATEGIL